MTSEKRISASQFKYRCLTLIDEVARTGGTIVVTKHGKPVARVVPATDVDPHALRGSVAFKGDIISPIEVNWHACA